jgi:hypothetical protein
MNIPFGAVAQAKCGLQKKIRDADHSRVCAFLKICYRYTGVSGTFKNCKCTDKLNIFRKLVGHCKLQTHLAEFVTDMSGS